MAEDTQMATQPNAEAQPEKLMGDDQDQDQDHMVTPGPDVPKLCSCRWVFCYISCIAMMFVYSVRVDISVAVVCMVKVNPPENATNTTGTAGCSLVKEGSSGNKPEFEWSDSLKASVLGGFFYGYTLSNIPGGFLADRYGGRRVFGASIFLSALFTLLHPALTRISGYLTLALRVLTGLASGPFFPAMHSLWGRWAPPYERSKLMAICYAGPYMGNIITLISSGFLCINGFDNGWGSIFYLIGIIGVVFTFIWFYCVHDSPNAHPRITEKEKQYLEGAVACKSRVTKVPWSPMIRSGAVWAVIVAHFCYNWSNYTLLSVLPLFMKEVLYFNIHENGLMSSIPYLGQFIGYTVVGYIADGIQQREWLSTRATRVLLQVISFVGCGGFLIATSYVKCTNAMIAVVFLFFGAFFMGISGGGFFVNHVDIAPSYAGILFGITNCISAMSGFLAPIVASALTPNHSQEEWQGVFFVCAAFMIFGALIFAIFAKGEVQSWATQGQSSCQKDKRCHYLKSTSHNQAEWQRVFLVCAVFMVFGAVIFAIFARGEVQAWAVHKESTILLEKKLSRFIRRTSFITPE